jgi:hypothetical protein
MGIQLIVPGRHAAKLLKAAEEPLNVVALRVAGRIVGTRGRALTPGRNDGYGAAGSQGGHASSPPTQYGSTRANQYHGQKTYMSRLPFSR